MALERVKPLGIHCRAIRGTSFGDLRQFIQEASAADEVLANWGTKETASGDRVKWRQRHVRGADVIRNKFRLR